MPCRLSQLLDLSLQYVGLLREASLCTGAYAHFLRRRKSTEVVIVLLVSALPCPINLLQVLLKSLQANGIILLVVLKILVFVRLAC